MARSKRHHYIAQSFQKRFCDECNKLWYSERDQEGNWSFEHRTPRGCFWKPNLNTTLENDTPSDVLEREFWQAVDEDVLSFLAIVDDSFARSIAPKVEGQILNDFKRLLAVVARRSPDATELPSANEVGLEFQEGLKQLFFEVGMPILPKHDDITWLKQNGRAILAKAKASFPEMVIEALKPYSVRWARCGPRSSFVLGSKSVYRAHNEGGTGHLDDPKTELFWPISPKLALVMLRVPTSNFPMCLTLDSLKVRSWNEAICKESRAVASHSPRLLRSLLGLR